MVTWLEGHFFITALLAIFAFFVVAVTFVLVASFIALAKTVANNAADKLTGRCRNCAKEGNRW